MNTGQMIDQAALTWVESQAAKIEARVRKELLSEIMYPQLIRVNSDIDEADDMVVTYVERPGTARTTPLAAGATDIPMTEVSFDRIVREAYMEGIAYGWDDDEILRARKLGKPLRDGRIRAARRAVEEKKEDVVLNGDEGKNWYGLLTNRDPACLNVEATSGGWAASKTTEAVNDLRKAFTAIRAGTDKVLMPDTLLLPVSAESFLFSMITDDNTTTAMPVIEYLRRYNPYTLATNRPMTIKVINQLDKAGPPDGTKATESASNAKATGHPMALMYDSREEVLRFNLPMDLTYIGPQRVAWTQKWYGRMKIGGNQIFLPRGLCYISGIGDVT